MGATDENGAWGNNKHGEGRNPRGGDEKWTGRAWGQDVQSNPSPKS